MTPLVLSLCRVQISSISPTCSQLVKWKFSLKLVHWTELPLHYMSPALRPLSSCPRKEYLCPLPFIPFILTREIPTYPPSWMAGCQSWYTLVWISEIRWINSNFKIISDILDGMMLIYMLNILWGFLVNPLWLNYL